jgi:hypothetical protein
MRTPSSLDTSLLVALLTVNSLACQTKSGHDGVSADHQCSSNYNSRWSQKNLQLLHSDARTCPFNLAPGAIFETGFYVYDWNTQGHHPFINSGYAKDAIVDVYDELGGTLLGSDDDHFYYDYPPSGQGDLVMQVLMYPFFQRGESPDRAIFDVDFWFESGLATANVRFDYYTGNDQ